MMLTPALAGPLRETIKSTNTADHSSSKKTKKQQKSGIFCPFSEIDQLAIWSAPVLA